MPRRSTPPALIVLLTAAAGLAAAPGARAQLQWSAVSLHPPGATNSVANDGSRGQVVGTVVLPGTVGGPYRWDTTGATPAGASLLSAGLLGGIGAVALPGAQFGQATTPSTPIPGSNYAAAWSGPGSSTINLNPSGYESSAVRGGGALPNGTFELVGTGTAPGGAQRPIVWTWPGGQSRVLPALSGVALDRHFAFAAGDGFQGGYYVDANQNTRALLWRPGATAPTVLPGSERSLVRGIGFGWAVGSNPDPQGVIKPTLWDLSSPTILGYLIPTPAGPGSSGDLADAYASPSTNLLFVGSATPVGGTQHALMLRLRNIPQALELLATVDLAASLQGNWGQSRANAIWADGPLLHIAGQAFNNDAQRFEAILWTAANPACYANCDASTNAPVLNALDFSCFLNRYVAGDPYANCDGSTNQPVLNALDFSCFLGRYVAGCP